MSDFRAGDALLALRRQLAWEGLPQASSNFHATEELQSVRDRVFEELAKWELDIDATVIEKGKLGEDLKSDEIALYRWAWRIHFERVAQRLASDGDELLVMTASLGTRRRRQAFHRAVEEVVSQSVRPAAYRTVSWSGASDPCLWVADFCSWAIQRKWERGDARSYVLISNRLRSEVEV
jgi:hypothetical protein